MIPWKTSSGPWRLPERRSREAERRMEAARRLPEENGGCQEAARGPWRPGRTADAMERPQEASLQSKL